MPIEPTVQPLWPPSPSSTSCDSTIVYAGRSAGVSIGQATAMAPGMEVLADDDGDVDTNCNLDKIAMAVSELVWPVK